MRFPQRNQNEKEELQAENSQIFHQLQNSLTSASLASLLSSLLSHLHQVLICKTYILSQLHHFWDGLRRKLASKSPYIASIAGMRLRLHKLQAKDKQVRKLKVDQQSGQQGWEDIDNVLHHQSLPYVSEIIRTALISRHHNDSLAGHFGIEKIQELLSRKYYWPTLRRDIKDYVRGCDICLASKAVRHKPYDDLQFLPVPTHR